MRLSRRVSSLLLMLVVTGLATVAFVVNTNLVLGREARLLEAQMRNDSLLVADRLQATFLAAEFALRDILGHVTVDDLRYPHPAPEAQRAATERMLGVMETVPNAFLVGLFDERCVATHTNLTVGFDASEREYCIALRDDPGAAVTVSPVYASNAGDLNVTIARRLPSDDGRFVGMAALGLALDVIDSYLDDVVLPPNHHLTVLDDGGILVGRRPAGDLLPGTRVLSAPPSDGVVDVGGGYLVGRARSPIDDSVRLYVARPLEDLPMVVVRSVPVDAIGGVWRPYITAGWFTIGLLWLLGLVALRAHWRTIAHAAELAALAHTDDLTGLDNRRSFTRRAAHELERAERLGRPLALGLIDLDELKAVNDRYGHAVGDAAIKAFADTCRSVTRRIDVSARIGGDEFALLLPDTSADAARAVAERLRERVRERSIHVADGATLRLSISLGLIILTSAENCDLDTLLRRADRALYDAKRRGRDGIVVSDDRAGSDHSG